MQPKKWAALPLPARHPRLHGYAGLVGGGRVAGDTLPGGETKWRREGVVGPS